MRIIAGEFRSRRLKTLPGLSLRPTSDRLRERLFSILGDAVRDAVFLDCFAGSGAVGLEALSRGASQAIFLEQSPAALAVLRENIASLGVAPRTRVIEGEASKGLKLARASVNDSATIFLDPPYADLAAYARAFDALEGRAGLIIVEHSSKSPLDPEGFEQLRLVKQGDSSLSFFRALSK